MDAIEKLINDLQINNSFFTEDHLLHIFNTILLFIIVWTLKNIFRRQVRRSNWRMEEKRKWYVTIRNWATLILIFGFISIWSTELQTFAVSVVAITAALIISGKELLMCIHGGLLRSFNSMFKVGDRIEIDGIRGDVIDTNLMVTKIMEIGPQNFTHQFTGRSITVPNSIFLTGQIINESFMHHYVLHVFKVAFKRSEDWKKAEECMLAAANEVCADFVDEAQKYMDAISYKEDLEIPRAKPRITYRFPNATELEMIIRIPTPASKKGNLEQAVLRGFMQRYPAFAQSNKEES